MKILVTGASGYIGRHLVECWKDSGHQLVLVSRNIEARYFSPDTGCINADITIAKDIQAAIVLVQPQLVVHLAASSKPNDCEVDQEACYLTNVAATSFIIDACKAVGARLIFLSTDFVFSDDGPYAETAACQPVNYYGVSKLEAEHLVMASGISYAIVRTVMVVGHKLPGQANTFLHWVKDSLGQGKAIKVFTDQVRSVTWVKDLCWAVDRLSDPAFSGVYHICGAEAVSPYELALSVADFLHLDARLISPVTSDTFPETAKRPKNSSLKIEKAQGQLGFSPATIEMILTQSFP